MDSAEALWRQYELHVDLYKHYLKIAIDFNVFYYAITGAILSYYLTHSEIDLIKYSLLLPLLMSVLFAGFFIYGARLMAETRDEIFSIRDKLEFETAPEVQVLAALLWIFSILMSVVAVAILYLIFFT